jgi:hypothetical protein
MEHVDMDVSMTSPLPTFSFSPNTEKSLPTPKHASDFFKNVGKEYLRSPHPSPSNQPSLASSSSTDPHPSRSANFIQATSTLQQTGSLSTGSTLINSKFGAANPTNTTFPSSPSVPGPTHPSPIFHRPGLSIQDADLSFPDFPKFVFNTDNLLATRQMVRSWRGHRRPAEWILCREELHAEHVDLDRELPSEMDNPFYPSFVRLPSLSIPFMLTTFSTGNLSPRLGIASPTPLGPI